MFEIYRESEGEHAGKWGWRLFVGELLLARSARPHVKRSAAIADVERVRKGAASAGIVEKLG